MKKPLILIAAATAVFAVASQAKKEDCGSCCAPAKQAVALQAKVDAKGVQRATVTVDNGFSPSTINVKVGKPVQLTFDVKSPGCASQVVFKGLNLRKSLQAGKKVVVSFTPKKSGSVSFTCQMGMYKGAVVAKR